MVTIYGEGTVELGQVSFAKPGYVYRCYEETGDADWVKHNYHVSDSLHQTQHTALLLASFIAAGMKELGYETTGFSYTYTGYSMVKLARDMVRSGKIGTVIDVNAEYLQDWLIDEIGAGNQTTTKMSVWRTDPKKSGISNCVGDIGTHIEDTVANITGLHPVKVAAILDRYGMDLDLNANILVEYENGTHGVYSQYGHTVQSSAAR